jgi:RimJ/RimL family protein N-acetyltransferase
MKPPFLTGERVYIRAMVLEDKDCAVAWFDSDFPVNAVRAEKFLRDEIKEIWAARRKYYVIVRTDNDQVIGGIKSKSWDMRAADLTIRMAPHLSPDEADSYKADALRLFVPWMRDEHEYMAQTIEIAADETACIAAAEEMDLFFGARFRGFLRRPGGRIDLLVYQALNESWQPAQAASAND